MPDDTHANNAHSGDAHAEGEGSGAGKQPDMTLLLKLTGLFLLVALVSIGLYWAIYRFFQVVPPFLAFILFLSFTMPTAFILRLGLNETVDANAASSNKYIKLIGATPTLVIIACLLALLGTVANLKSSIIPDPPSQPRYLIANLAVTCWSGSENNTDPAPYLLTLITADSSYITDIRSELTQLKNERTQAASRYDFTFITQDSSDDFYKVLKNPAGATAAELNQIQTELRDNSNWLAFTVPANDPHTVTILPIPTIVGKTHTARLFIVIKQPRRSRVIATADPTGGGAIPTANPAEAPPYVIRQLAVLGLSPNAPESNRQFAKLDMQVYSNRTCWIRPPADQTDSQ
jgi:hypothetical protein